MLAEDSALRRLERWSQWLKYPLYGSLALVAAGLALGAIFGIAWLVFAAAALLAWLAIARLTTKVWRDLYLSDYRWRLDHASPREGMLLRLARHAVWSWDEEVPAEATHAVLVATEIGGQLQVESFLERERAEERLTRRVDLLAGEVSPVVVGLVELDAEPGRAVVEVSAGRPEGRRSLDSLPEAPDGWLVGV